MPFMSLPIATNMVLSITSLIHLANICQISGNYLANNWQIVAKYLASICQMFDKYLAFFENVFWKNIVFWQQLLFDLFEWIIFESTVLKKIHATFAGVSCSIKRQKLSDASQSQWLSMYSIKNHPILWTYIHVIRWAEALGNVRHPTSCSCRPIYRPIWMTTMCMAYWCGVGGRGGSKPCISSMGRCALYASACWPCTPKLSVKWA